MAGCSVNIVGFSVNKRDFNLEMKRQARSLFMYVILFRWKTEKQI